MTMVISGMRAGGGTVRGASVYVVVSSRLMSALVALVAASVAGCSSAPAPSATPAMTSAAGTAHMESPAAPVSDLAGGGRHCFGSAAEAAIAAARIEAYYLRRRLDYEAVRRRFDAGGPLMPYGSDTMGEVSDPDRDNCVEVSTYGYDDRFLPPAPSTTSVPRSGH